MLSDMHHLLLCRNIHKDVHDVTLINKSQIQIVTAFISEF